MLALKVAGSNECCLLNECWLLKSVGFYECWLPCVRVVKGIGLCLPHYPRAVWHGVPGGIDGLQPVPVVPRCVDCFALWGGGVA